MIYKHVVNAAFRIYAQRGEVVAKRGEVGVCALSSHGNYIVNHGKSWKNHGIVVLAHLSRRLMGELIVYQSLRRPSVNIFKHLL